MEKMLCISEKEYILLGKSFLNKCQVSDEHAVILMKSLLDADQKGVYTHGFYRLPTYIEQLNRGNINSNPAIRMENGDSLIKVMNGDGGLGSVISSLAMKEAIELSHAHGVGVVGVSGSNHFGTAAYYAEMAAKQNQIGIVITNASPAIAPTGGKQGILGNNPWSISVNTNLGYPITLDMANSISRGKIRLKALKGEIIPVGWALNKDGQPTTNANEALEGLLLPIGEHKGYGITLMMEILAGVLTGAQFGNQNPLIDEDGKRNNGHLFISLNIESFMSLSSFRERTDELIEMVKSTPKIHEEIDILLPGETEWLRKLNQQKGMVEIPESVVGKMKTLCKEYDVYLPTIVQTNNS